MKKDEEMEKEITTELVRELIDYDQDTGVFTWRARDRHWFKREQDFKMWNTRFAGSVTGCVHRDATGYPTLAINVLGRTWLAHRLAFIYMGEALPDQVDHLNRDSVDNRWKNLSSSSAKENMKNKSMFRNNTSGVAGVSWHKARGKWEARVHSGGERKSLGYFEDLAKAAEVIRTFKEVNGYSKGHGKELANYVDRTGLCL
jgi:hypothetical protein